MRAPGPNSLERDRLNLESGNRKSNRDALIEIQAKAPRDTAAGACLREIVERSLRVGRLVCRSKHHHR